jgi:hypothetical protein
MNKTEKLLHICIPLWNPSETSYEVFDLSERIEREYQQADYKYVKFSRPAMGYCDRESIQHYSELILRIPINDEKISKNHSIS